jgi:NAD(P)-dependent dehydrogenase (short-subunit alcohol dehydrogenase family)
MAARTILVTGGTGALGTAVTRRLLEDGHRVAVTWLNAAEAAHFSDDAGKSLMPIRADVTDGASIQEAVAHIRSHLGPSTHSCTSWVRGWEEPRRISTTWRIGIGCWT